MFSFISFHLISFRFVFYIPFLGLVKRYSFFFFAATPEGVQSPLQSCRSFLSHKPLRWAIFKILKKLKKSYLKDPQ
jgi:hypothetical protein